MGPDCFDSGTPKQVEAFGVGRDNKQDCQPNRGHVEEM